jgi:hypothetical protein
MREIVKKTKLPITILLMLLTLMAQGAYAAENSTVPDAQHMDFDEIRNKSLEMMTMSIESIGTMQSSGDYEELEESLTILQERMEMLKSELENAEDEEELNGIMDGFRTLVEDAPEDIRKELMGSGGMSEPGNGNFSMDNNTMRGPGRQGNLPGGNDSMKDGNFKAGEPEGGRPGNEVLDKENNGLLSGLINKIKAIFS